MIVNVIYAKTILKGKTFQSFKTGRTYFMKFDFQCTSSNLVYLISCKRCYLQYVRSTRTEFKVRFRNPKSALRTSKKPVKWLFKILITKEAYWMAQLFCVFPTGLNKRFEIHSNKRINYGK